MKCLTIQGDTWDLIAYRELGSSDYTELLINKNRDKIAVFLFEAGVELDLPEIETPQTTVAKLPPWRS